jgi:adenine-specific DNA-methyltransferase
MAKKDYNSLSKEELIELVDKLESKKKYGLVWDEERVPEKVVMDCQQKLPVLTEVSEKSITTNESEPTHIIIEGDNYHSLSVLSYTHKDKIDIIYIDPPYNTGNKTEWKYNDQYVDDNDNYRHSKWLNMMGKRLELAKDLIKPGGSIFLSIGDDEVANLKLLCDKILGLNNFITIMSRIAKTASNKGKYFAPSCDYVLLYTKQAEDLNDDSFNQEVNSDLYKKDDEDGLGMYRDDIALYQSSLDPLRGCVNQRYFIQDPDGGLLIPPGEIFPDEKEDAAFVPPKKKTDKVWRWSYATYLQQKELLVFKATKTSPLLDENGKQAKYNIYTKSYLKERQKTGVKPRNFLIEKEFLNRKGADYIKKMGISFDYSKPKALIDYLFSLSNANKDAIILDFFAGSGTTGEVVLDLNKKDKGKRQFIVCTNNEIGFKEEKEFKKQNKLTEEDYKLWIKEGNPKYLEFLEANGVATSVCYPRIKNVVKGYKEISKAAKDIKGKGNNIRYFQTSFVPNSKNKDQLRLNITKKCTEMLCLKEGIFNLHKQADDWQIFTYGGKYLAVYYDFPNSSLDELKEEMNKIEAEKVLYCFTVSPHGLEEENFTDWKDIRLEPIPQKILDVYKRIFKK